MRVDPALPLVEHRVSVRSPATSANLGPGFDALGLAVGVHDELQVRVRPALGEAPGHRLAMAGEGAADLAEAGERHLVLRAMRATFDLLGLPQPWVEIVAANRVPHGRGMGSSAAAVVAGILAARAVVRDGADRLDGDAVLALATRLEGHPDNVAPALRGGLTLAWADAHDGAARAVGLPLDPRVHPVLYVPPFASSTAATRGMLPERVAFSDATAQLARVGLLVEALGRRPELLLDATEDRLHQRYRAPAMPATAELVARLRTQGHAAAVSGAGPTVIVLSVRPDTCPPPPPGWRRLDPAVDTAGAMAVAEEYSI